MKYKKYPDINDLLDYFSEKFKKDKEEVYLDLARKLHDIISR